RLAHQRPRRPAAGERRQLRDAERAERPRSRDAAAADHGGVHAARGRDPRTPQAGARRRDAAGDRLRPQQHPPAGHWHPAIDRQIDTTTGTIRIKAVFPNSDESLFPQQFVNVVLLLDTLRGATLIPQSGVQRGAPGTYVYVVNAADQTVSVRKVTLGPGDAS